MSDSDSSSSSDSSEPRYPQRKRRKLQRRFSFSNFERPPWEVPKGPGTKLSKIDCIKAHVTQTSRHHPIMRLLHLTMYARPGKKNELKKNILAFSGLDHLEQDEDWQEFCQNKLLTKSRKDLLDIHQFLCLKGNRDNKSDTKLCGDIAEFLYKPEKKATKSQGAFVSERDRPKKKKRKGRRKKQESSSSSEEEESESSSSEEETRRRKRKRRRK